MTKPLKRRLSTWLCCLPILTFSWHVQAADLMTVYRQALANDPTFQAARAQWLAEKEGFPISLSSLLPSVDLEGLYNPTHNRLKTATASKNYHNNITELTATVTQPIFDFSAWAAVSESSATVKQATATFDAALQDLMIRTATAYFNVLQANDNLHFTQAEKKAIGRQLEQTQERYKVGLIAITDVYETKASYESILAQEIVAKDNLVNRIEELREITGKDYNNIFGVKDNLALIAPKPMNINTWVKSALKQNYTLKAAHFGTLAAKKNVSVQSRKRYPTVDVAGVYDYTNQTNPSDTGKNILKQLGGEVTVDFPILQGGLVTATARQAAYLYQQTSAEEIEAYRNTIANARNAYLGTLASISQTRANKQAIVANKSSLKATEAGYIVGTRTIIDVLDVQSSLYEAQKNFSQSQYQYLLELLKLKEAAGTLSTEDLGKINSWLGKKVSLAVYHKITHTSSFSPEHTVKMSITKSHYSNKNKTKQKLPKPIQETHHKKTNNHKLVSAVVKLPPPVDQS